MKHRFYINDGRVIITEGEDIFNFLVDEDFKGLRARYVSLNRRPRRGSSSTLTRVKKVKLLGTDYLMRFYRLIRRQLLFLKNSPVYYYYD